jgi:hypothetical protein
VRAWLALPFLVLGASSALGEIAPVEVRVLEKVQGLGCRASLDDVAALSPEMNEYDLKDAIKTVVQAGTAFLDKEGSLVLTEASCPGGYADGPPKPGDDIRAVLIEAVTANDCRMTSSEADVALPKLGLEEDSTADMVMLMVEFGEALVDDGGQTLVLLTEGCK